MLKKMKLKKICILILSVFVFMSTFTSIANASISDFSASLMAPLRITDFAAFQYELEMAKDMGAESISVDVWWGDVEKYADNQFDWSYYDEVFAMIRNANLEIIAIMSFHQAGGNVGDTYHSYLPSWVWGKYTGNYFDGMTIAANDLKYVSELGNVSNEFLSLWVDELIQYEYIDFMNAFENQFGTYANYFSEINISAGPSGELRFPSYNSHDAGNMYSGYPNKGYLQSYSNIAIKDFRGDMLLKYGGLAGVNVAWGLAMGSEYDIRPPNDGGDFFYHYSKPYLNTQYGRDFIAWYNNELVLHGDRMLQYVNIAFDGQFRNIVRGMKMPGIHWQIANSEFPRTAEITAGLINTDFSANNSYGYKNILNMIKAHNNTVLHFTCLEMSDYNSEPTSRPKTLVRWLGESAKSVGVVIKGENALNGGNDSSTFWHNINHAIDNHFYRGITILRMNDAVFGESNRYFRDLVNKNITLEDKNSSRITFRLHEGNTIPGENIYVIGSHPNIGNWDTSKAVRLFTYNYPSWTVTIEGISKSTELEFKFIKKKNGSVIWEDSIPNRGLIVSENYIILDSNWNR
ncbi:MAG: beta-amylase [Alkaliphilus sp.]|nr:MAG: beta-amylase [Alkaliphilus sp.]